MPLRPVHSLAVVLLVATAAMAATNRIYGGQTARAGQFPYQAQVRRGGTYCCSGAIIAPLWILTGAQCVRAEAGQNYTVVTGAVRLYGDGQLHQVDRIVSHAGYDPSRSVNDIAVVRLTKAIEFGARVRPIEFRGPLVRGQQPAVVSGWGEMPGSEQFAEVLQYLNTTTISNEECKRRVDRYVDHVHAVSICTLWGAPGHGICGTDAGAPLVVAGRLVGLASWVVDDYQCAAGYADVYTSVFWFVMWIERKIDDSTNWMVGESN